MGARILVVEDNVDSSRLVDHLLSRGGHVIHCARTGAEAVDAALAFRPDLVLMDLDLPVLDGYGAALLIRARPELAATPIVAITAFATAGEGRSANYVSFEGFIAKPFQPESFLAEVERYVPDQRSERMSA